MLVVIPYLAMFVLGWLVAWDIRLRKVKTKKEWENERRFNS